MIRRFLLVLSIVLVPACSQPRETGCVLSGVGMHRDSLTLFRAYDCPDGTAVLVPDPDLKLPGGPETAL